MRVMRGPGHIAGVRPHPGPFPVQHRHRLRLPLADDLGDFERLGILGDPGLAVRLAVQLEQLIAPFILQCLAGKYLEQAGALQIRGEAAEQLPAKRDILRVDRAAVAKEWKIDPDQLWPRVPAGMRSRPSMATASGLPDGSPRNSDADCSPYACREWRRAAPWHTGRRPPAGTRRGRAYRHRHGPCRRAHSPRRAVEDLVERRALPDRFSLRDHYGVPNASARARLSIPHAESASELVRDQQGDGRFWRHAFARRYPSTQAADGARRGSMWPNPRQERPPTDELNALNSSRRCTTRAR
jgi:hypothetical protein